MNERVSFGNEKLSPVLERLRRKTIYEQGDFKSPYQILQRSIALSRDRDRDPDSFLRETTTLFSSFSRTNKTSDINVNDLIATLFVLRDNPDKTKYRFPDSVKQGEISLLIDSLLGKNLDFLSGKKDSSIILPAYLILRSLKENHSWWTQSFLRKKKDRLQTIELKNRLLNSIHTKKSREMLERRFKQSLDIEEKDETIIKKEKKLLVLPRLNLITLEGSLSFPFADQFSDFNIQKTRPEIKDSQKLSDERIFMDLILEHGSTSINENGKLNIDRKSLKKILEEIKNDDNLKVLYSQLKSILGSKNSVWSVNSAALITKFSDDIRPDSASWFFTKHKNPEHVTNLIQAFELTLSELFNGISSNKNIGLDKAIDKTGGFNFSQTNRQIAESLYKHYLGKSNPSIDELGIFIKLPGVDSTIMSLRKMSLIRSLERNLAQLNYDYEKFSSPYLQYSGADIGVDLVPHHEKMIDLAKGNFNVVGFKDLTQTDIIKQLAYFSVEKYLRDNNVVYTKNKRLRAKDFTDDRVLLVPNDLVPEKRNILNSTGLPLPIVTIYNVENNKLEVYLYDIYLGHIPVEVEKVSQ